MEPVHCSRSWAKDPFAPQCGCALAPCGLVDPRDDCDQHGLNPPRTWRQIHRAEDCPAAKESTDAR